MALLIFYFIFIHSLLLVMAADYSMHCSEEISVNCGSSTTTTTTTTSQAHNGREWMRDVPLRSLCSPQLKGSSFTSISAQDLQKADHIPYSTVRISKSQFSYVFHVNSGQKFIRLHFNPASHRGFKKYNDFFNVEAGPFMLLGNFSASLTAEALGVKFFVREFCMNVEQNQTLELKFSPMHSHSGETYAFVNGIEIIPMPNGLYYTHDGDLGAKVIGGKSRIFLDNGFALETVRRSNIREFSISSVDDPNLFKRWAISKNREFHKIVKDFTWKIPVDVGFGYLVRLHFCELQLNMAGRNEIAFSVNIDGNVANTESIPVQGSTSNEISQYKDYVVMMKGHKQEGRRDLVIDLQLEGCELSNGPLKGFEIFKMSNPDNSLAGSNPWLISHVSPSRTLPKFMLLLVFGKGYTVSTVIILMINLVNIIVYMLRRTWEAASSEDGDASSSSSIEGLCRRFSLAEILSATRNFSDGAVIGRGGFGKVYKGYINEGQVAVAIKRLKSNSKQGAHEFWTEVETLTQLRHVHLVSLIGYCNENQEMILVYEYMPSGTLADHCYKQCSMNDSYSPLSWEQWLRICIGAARGLDYLHTGTNNGVIHRDVKSSNILLDENYVAKISDFGLAKVGKTKQLQSYVSTNVKGTFGYMDPDYFLTRKLTRKTDVYAFGVVLLEVMCGRAAVDLRFEENQRSLTMWVREYIDKGEIDQIVAPHLRGQISPNCMKIFVESSQKCLHSDPRKRPTMANLVAQLECALDQQQRTKSLMPRNATESDDAHPHIGDNNQYVGLTQHTTSSAVEQYVSASPKEKTDNKLVEHLGVPAREVTSNKGKTSSNKKPSRLWLWEAFWNREKIPKKKEFLFPDGPCPRFSISDILAATNNLHDSLITASDYFYDVYESIGYFHMKVTIQLVKHVHEDKLYEICTEIGMLSQVSHPNLASIIGYCYHEGKMFIVYDYVGKRALSDLENTKTKPLTWRSRLQICIDAARGLKHLHTGTSQTIVYRDLRPANIFLDKNSVVKLVNFGFSHFGPMSDLEGLSTTLIGGKFPYLAPDFFSLPKLTEKTDVYSFGLILLEMICGTNTNNTDDMDCKYHLYSPYNLVHGLKRSIQRETLHQMIDPYLSGNIAVQSLSEFLKVALSSLLDQPTSRPSIDKVIESLELAIEAQELVEATTQIDKCKLFDNNGLDLAGVYQELSYFAAKSNDNNAILDVDQDSVSNTTFGFGELLKIYDSRMLQNKIARKMRLGHKCISEDAPPTPRYAR